MLEVAGILEWKYGRALPQQIRRAMAVEERHARGVIRAVLRLSSFNGIAPMDELLYEALLSTYLTVG